MDQQSAIIKNFRNNIILIFLLTIIIAIPSFASRKGDFYWCEHQRDGKLWREIEQVFSKELTPDIEEEVAPIVAYKYKYIRAIGIFDNVALVIISNRETIGSPDYDEYSEGYSYDFISSKKSVALTVGVYWQWTYIGAIMLEKSYPPDIFFTYSSCVDCEAEYLMTGYHYDKELRQWMLRTWPKGEEALLIGSDILYGDDADLEINSIYDFYDFNDDGFQDICLWRRETLYPSNTITNTISDTVMVYAIRHKKIKELVPTGAELNHIKQRLCKEHPESSLCVHAIRN